MEFTVGVWGQRMVIRQRLLACMVVALLALTPIAVVGQTSQPDPDRQARVAAALEMMSVAGSEKQFDQFMPVLVANMTRAFIGLAPGAADEIRHVMGEVVKRFSDRKREMVEKIAELYAAELTLEELQELVRFYTSPVGAKFVAIQPSVGRQTIALSQQWGERIGREIDQEARRELKKRGIKI